MHDVRPTVRVGIVDDHEAFRMGVRAGLQNVERISVLWDSPTGDGALHQMHRDPVDVVLLDLNLGPRSQLSGSETCLALTTGWPGARVLVVTALDARAPLAESIAMGATDVIEKDRPFTALVAAILEVAGDRPPTAARNHARRVAHGALSSRERDVLELIAKGATTNGIAARLGVSPKTVDKHVQNLLRKLGAQNRTHAVAMFWGQRAVDPDPPTSKELTPPAG